MGSSGPTVTGEGQAALARGATIGRYVVLGLVGRGGMGEVYAAYDPELDRKVAVKLLRVKPGAGVSLAEGRQRTLREAQAIARLSHPNVVVVYDVGTFRDQVFIAMEFVDGNTATYWVESQRRTWHEILKIFVAAGRGLMAAHEKGLVHRDFKPDNVMVGRDAQVRVMDFGLARQMNERAPTPTRGSPKGPAAGAGAGAGGTGGGPSTPDHVAPGVPIAIAEHSARPGVDPMTTVVLNMPANGPHDSPSSPASAMFDVQLTRTGAMMGTPAYMAPEQFLGTPTDARTDQFSFCIALYEALYNERPFAGNTMFALTSSVVQGIVRDAPGDSKVPMWVRKVLLRGLRPQAVDRWPSMGELIEALGKNPSVRRKKWATAAAVAVVLVAAGLGIRHSAAQNRDLCNGGPAKLAGIWELQAQGEAESTRRAQVHSAFLKTGKGYAADVYATVSRALTGYAQSWANMRHEACEASQVRREQSTEVMDLRMTCLDERLGGLRALTDVFAEANGDVVENAVNAANALGSLDRCADVPLLRAVVRPAEDPATRARVADLRNRLAAEKARLDAGRWKEAQQGAPSLVSGARALGYQPLIAETLLLAGTISLRLNNTDDAEKALTEAYLIADASRHDEVRAEAATSLVWVIGYLDGRVGEGQRWAKTADAILHRLGGHELLQAWLLNDVGAVLGLMGDKNGMLREEQKALALKEKALGSDHPDVGISEGNVAFALQEQGRNQEALTHIDRSVIVLENGLGAAHPDLAVQINNRGEILKGLGRSREARQSFERARIIWERELGLEDRNLGYALTGIGTTYLADGEAASALVPLERAFKIREIKETDEAKRGETRFALARALWESNRDRGRARMLAEEARESYAKTEEKSRLAEVESWLRGHGAS